MIVVIKHSVLAMCLIFASAVNVFGNKKLTENYISAYKDIAIAEMKRTGIPASIKLAQVRWQARPTIILVSNAARTGPGLLITNTMMTPTAQAPSSKAASEPMKVVNNHMRLIQNS